MLHGTSMNGMPRVTWKALIGSLCLIPAFLGTAGAQDVVVKRFGGGSGVGAVGIIDASQDTEINGPQALTAGENGELFLLDQVNNRIVRFDPKRPDAEARILGLPEDMQPTDLVVRKSDILVWDGSVRALQAKGPEDTSYRGLEEVSTRAGEDEFALSAFAQMGSQAPGGCDRPARRKHPCGEDQARPAAPHAAVHRLARRRLRDRRHHSRPHRQGRADPGAPEGRRAPEGRPERDRPAGAHADPGAPACGREADAHPGERPPRRRRISRDRPRRAHVRAGREHPGRRRQGRDLRGALLADRRAGRHLRAAARQPTCR